MEAIFLDETQVAELTGIALSTLRNRRFENKGIPYYRIGRSIRYKKEDVLDFIEKCRVETGDSKAA